MSLEENNIEFQFKNKIKEIHNTPYKLRKTIQHWPYYETLKKYIYNCSTDEYYNLKNKFKIIYK